MDHPPLIQPRPVEFRVDPDRRSDSFTAAASVQLGLAHTRHSGFPSRPWTLDDLEAIGARIELTSGAAGSQQLEVGVSFGPTAVAQLACHGSVTHVHAAASSPAEVDAVSERLRAALFEPQLPREATRVPVHFWTMSTHGPRPMRMKIEAPRWTEIADNYSPEVRAELERAMHADHSEIEGVALWRGEPGTGKTTALRALAMEWAQWCDVHVIVDPEVFLGEQASYMMDVLFSFQDPHTAHLDAGMSAHDAHDDGFHERYRRQALGSRAKLVVLEDAGELVAADARVSAGQALSRLLNITDGMLGQGANVSVLVTTNEEISRLHPAVQRPGRCWSQIEFAELSPEDAADWLREHGLDPALATGPMPLAELYALRRGDGVELDDIAGAARVGSSTSTGDGDHAPTD